MDKIFITGIGTNVGKSYVTGWLANHLIATTGKKVMTLKMIQTGNVGYSEDIDVHRKIMGQEHNQFDKDFVTAPIIMSYPASPHLAAKIDHVEIDLGKIESSLEILGKEYDTILMEGAGGLMVPITEGFLTIDYIAEKRIPVCLAINGILGSINHILLSLLALKQYGIEVKYVIYNSHFDEDKIICQDTIEYIKKVLARDFPKCEFHIMPSLNI